jgi:AcrR family transcriptional regulator
MNPSPGYSREPWKAFEVRQRKLDSKREAVLRTAAQLFLEQGYRRTSLSGLAKRLNITKPALYYYFRNKEEILVSCYQSGIARIEASLDGALVGQGNGLDKTRAYIEAYARVIVSEDFGRCVAMLDDSELSPGARREVRNLKRQIDNSLRGYIEQGIADGSIAPCNVKLAAFALAGAINWIGAWYRPEGELSPEEIARQFALLLTNGLVSHSLLAATSGAGPKNEIKPGLPQAVRAVPGSLRQTHSAWNEDDGGAH